MWDEDFLENTGEGSGEFNSSWVRKILLNSKLFVLIELLRGSTKFIGNFLKHLELSVQRKKQNCFALLQGGKGPRPVSHLADGCPPCSRVLLPFTAKGFSATVEASLRKVFQCSNCGLLKYLNLKKTY